MAKKKTQSEYEQSLSGTLYEGSSQDINEPMPSLWWRVLAVPVLLFSIFSFISLVTYNWKDVSVMCSMGDMTVLNLMGKAGALYAFDSFRTLGISAYTIPLWGAICFVYFIKGWRIRYKYIWMILITLSLSGLFQQFFKNHLVDLLGVEYLNIAPNGGGVIGRLLVDRLLTNWLGFAGMLSIVLAIFFISLFFLIGPMNVLSAIHSLYLRIKTDALLDKEDRIKEREYNRQLKHEEKLRREEARKAEKEQRRFEKEEKSRLKAESKQRAEEERVKAEKERRRLKAEEEALSHINDTQVDDDDNSDIEDLDDEPVGIFILGKDGDEGFTITSSEPLQKTSSDNVEKAEVKKIVQEPVARIQESSKENKKDKNPSAGLAISKTFKLPPLSILNKVESSNYSLVSEEEIKNNVSIIENTLDVFGFPVKVVNVISGPVITCYEIRPPTGVRASKINAYVNDLQMALEAYSIRILAPIPGKSVMGIEVPNKNRKSVCVRELIESAEWKAATEKMELPLLIGKDISGKPVFSDLTKMPHLLVAGATGSGKSVCLNALLLGLMMSRTPEDLRLILVDPKKVEFVSYTNLPHLVVPIINNETEKVTLSLKWAIAEMDRRLDLFKAVNVRNIVSFNNREKQSSLFPDNNANGMEIPDKIPYIIIVLDEVGDLMVTSQAEIEPLIVRLAQLARATGIHLILATQRPTTNVITGKIKTNIPGRIAFKTASRVDSATIIDTVGTEQLLGMGDMLHNCKSNGQIERAQGVWASDQEIDEAVNWYKKQGECVYVSDLASRLEKVKNKPIDGFSDGDGDSDGSGGDDADYELMKKALACIVETGRASTSSIQRYLRIGFNRAARIMDELEERGCIGPAVGSGSREILRTTLEEDNEFDNSLSDDI